jgi:predicted anti-sigma-YlaC factor YlaD
MLSCKELVALSSDLLDARLSLRQRVAVRLHLAMCGRCRRFIRQMKLTQTVLRRLPDTPIPELDSLAERLAAARRKTQSGDGA